MAAATGDSDNTVTVMTLMINSHCLQSAWLCQSRAGTFQRQTFTLNFALTKISGLGSPIGPSRPALHPSLHPGGWPVETVPPQAPHPWTWLGATQREHQQTAAGRGTHRRVEMGCLRWPQPVSTGHTQCPSQACASPRSLNTLRPTPTWSWRSYQGLGVPTPPPYCPASLGATPLSRAPHHPLSRVPLLALVQVTAFAWAISCGDLTRRPLRSAVWLSPRHSSWKLGNLHS